MSIKRIRRKLRNTYYFFKYKVKVLAHGPFEICYPQNVSISAGCSINHGVFILGYIGIEIGCNVTLSARCMVLDAGLDLTSKTGRRHIGSKIVIEDDVWIGANAVILSGVTLGKGSVIAAGAVVNLSLIHISEPTRPY